MEDLIWLDAVQFADYGGWQVDSQFVLQMGQSYLIALQKPGFPVADAVTQMEVAEKGRYRIWVRSRNWIRTSAPGSFTLIVNSQPAGRSFGTAPTEEWIWEIAGDFDLPDGFCEFRLVDQSGYAARCAALIVTRDFDFTPPQDVGRLQQLRARLLGLPTQIQEGGSYAVIVAGGGPGGIPAAVAAARMGQSVLLLQNRPVLGGNASTEAGVGFDGASSRQPHAREGGIAEEIRRIRDRHDCSWQEALERLVTPEPNLTVLLQELVVDAETEGDLISAVVSMHTGTLVRTRHRAAMFIDCSGDGWLGYFAGARYRIGREARWQYGEELAPHKADNITMSGCLMGSCVSFVAEETDRGISWSAPDWCYRFPPGRQFGRPISGVQGHWWIENPGDYDDLWEAERTRDELIRISLSFYGWLKNDWDEKEKAARHDLIRMPIYNAKRENRRFIGDYVLSEQDCVQGRTFSDVIGHAGWTIDVHHPHGIFSGEEGPFHANQHVPLVQIPYRCLYSRNITNLLFAGRCISVSHVALGTVRVQNTIAVAGQAAGTAAALANRCKTTPRGIYEQHLQTLQQTLMRHDQHIPGLVNSDEDDLARKATVTASSWSTREVFQDRQGVPGEWRLLDRPRAGMLPRDEDPAVADVWLYLANRDKAVRTVVVHARKERDPGRFWSDTDAAVVSIELPPETEGWTRVPLDLALEERYLWLLLEPCSGVAWRTLDMAPLDWFRASDSGQGVAIDGRWGMMMRLQKPSRQFADCSPRQVINGCGRILSADVYLWSSDPSLPLPADLTLSWPEPERIGEVCLTFDTDMNNPPMTYPRIKVPETCATDYVLSCRDGSGWRDLAAVSGNYQRRRVHHFPAIDTDELRLTILKTGGHPSARVTEVRCYAENKAR